MNLPTSITTDRLLLRKPVPSDAQILFDSYTSDPEVVKYLTWKKHSNVSQSIDFIALAINNWTTGDEFLYVICTLLDARPFGTITLKPKVDSASIGYVIAKKKWGKGYVTEALEALVATVWKHTTLNLITVYCDAENIGSAKVLKKVGFTFKEVRKGYSIHPNISNEPRDALWFELERAV